MIYIRFTIIKYSNIAAFFFYFDGEQTYIYGGWNVHVQASDNKKGNQLPLTQDPFELLLVVKVLKIDDSRAGYDFGLTLLHAF